MNEMKQQKLIIYLFFLILIFSFPILTYGQEPFLYDTGTMVVLKIPSKLIGFEKAGFWDGSLKYGTVIDRSTSGGLIVGGLADWKTAGWPLMRQLTINKITYKSRLTEIELNDPLFKIRLHFATTITDINAAFREISFVGLVSEFESSEYYQNEIIENVLPQIFRGRLAAIPTKAKLQLLKEVNYIDSAIRTERYKDDIYLVLNAGGDIQIYNTIHMNQLERISHAINQRVISYIKRIARILKYHSSIDGIKVEISLPYKNFVTEHYNDPNYDNLEFYAPMEAIRQYAEDELDNQEFAAEAILLVNGNRTRIPILESR